MPEGKYLVILSFLVVSVFLLRAVRISQPSSFSELARQLQQNPLDENSTDTLSKTVSQKLCGTYLYTSPTLEEKQKANSVLESISALRTDSTFRDLILKGNIQSDLYSNYLKGFIPFLAALGVPLIVSGLLFICCVINWSCICCPSCNNIRCGLCDKPKDNSSMKVYACFNILFSLLVFGAAFWSSRLFNDISEKVNGTLCQTVYMLEEMYNGKESEGWIGVDSFKNSLQDIGDNLFDTKNLFRKNAKKFSELEDMTNEISDDMHQLEKRFSHNNLTRPYFLEEDSYNPTFVQTLGDNLVDAHEGLRKFRENLTHAKSDYDTAIGEFSVKRDQVITALDQGYLEIKGLGNDIKDTFSWIDENGDNVKLYSKHFSKGLQVALLVLLGLSGVALLSGIINFWSKFKYLTKLIQLNWFLLGSFMVALWISAGVLFPATVISVELCQVVDGVLTNNTFAKQAMDAFFGVSDSSLKNSILTCLHGDAQLINNLNVKDKFSIVNSLIKALDDSTLSIDEGQIPTSIDTNSFRSYLNEISSNDIIDDEKLVNDLNVLTQLSHSNIDDTECANVRDFWVLNDQNCTTLQLTQILNNQDPDNYKLGENLCIPLTEWMQPNKKNISTRYTQSLLGGCSSMADPSTGSQFSRANLLKLIVDRFVQNRIQLGQLIQQIDTDTGKIDAKASSLLIDAKEAMKVPFHEVKDVIQSIQASVFDEENGLVYNTECSFVETRIRSLNDELCVDLIPTIYYTSIALIVGSAMCSVLTMTLFFLVRKFFSKKADPNLDRKVYPMDQQEIKKEVPSSTTIKVV